MRPRGALKLGERNCPSSGARAHGRAVAQDVASPARALNSKIVRAPFRAVTYNFKRHVTRESC